MEVLDANTGEGLPGKLLVQEIERRAPKVAGMTLFTPDLGTFGQILPDIKDLLKRGVIGEFVIGGHHASYQPEIISQIGLNYGVMNNT